TLDQLYSSKTFDFISPFSLSECLTRLYVLPVESTIFPGSLSRTVRIFEKTTNEYSFEIEECRRRKSGFSVIAKARGSLTREKNTGETRVCGNLYTGDIHGLMLLVASLGIVATIYAWNTGGIEAGLLSLLVALPLIGFIYWVLRVD